MKESDLAQPVADWLRSRGLRVYPEEMGCDLIATDDVRLVAVELKKNLTFGVLRQCNRWRWQCDETYAAISSRPRSGEVYDYCRQWGIGILRVESNFVTVVLEAANKPDHPVNSTQREWTFRRLKLKPAPNEIVAGIPNLKGNGPMQKLVPIVTEYFRQNPKATWKQAFAEIPNHYANYKSFGQHMAHARVSIFSEQESCK